MKRLILIPALMATLATPVQAQESDTFDRFLNLLEQFTTDSEGLMQQFIDEMGPTLNELQDTIKDWSNYSAPEVLPNGDIIIRRKPDVLREKPLPKGTREI
tara:strand:+ start:8584 stop:8886 length:303 start_codon:yes stop_codon:yes gene_type:complete